MGKKKNSEKDKKSPEKTYTVYKERYRPVGVLFTVVSALLLSEWLAGNPLLSIENFLNFLLQLVFWSVISWHLYKMVNFLGESSREFSLTNSPPAQLESLQVTPQNSQLLVGGVQQFSVIGLFDDHQQRILSDEVIWQSSDPQVAEFDDNQLGYLRIHSEGVSQIHVTVEVSEMTALPIKAETSLTAVLTEPDPAEDHDFQ
jgi:hypothetical protein